MTNPPDRELAIFSAVRRLPRLERAAYLDQACAGDTALRERIESLLCASDEAGDFLENSSVVPPKTDKTIHQLLSPAEKAGDNIGHYKLLQQIGEGGCGVVYMAEQEEPVRRRVALKVIKLGMDTKQVIARFEAERQALALMDHPNIAKVLDAGATETGRPFFVMELVRGTKITEYCDANDLSTPERLELFIQVCRAVQHAHQKGVIHRDLKPSNILVTLSDGLPLPKVIDFGIAKATHGKLTDKTLFTAFEQFIGTPAYMSPEQAELSAQDVDTRSDIYSLGVLLYELLTGQTPFNAAKLLQAGLDAMRRTIREQEPARPSTCLSTMLGVDLAEIAKHRKAEPPKLIHLVRGDLDWIVMKAMEKDRTRRYETANGLAVDIQRHINNEPVLASPPGNFYKFQKWVRRHKLIFISASVVTLALIFALGVTVVAMLDIQRENHQLREAKVDALEKLRAAYLAEARIQRTSGQAGQRFVSLETVGKAAAIRPDLAVRNEAIAALAMSDVRLSLQPPIKVNASNPFMQFSPSLDWYAVGQKGGSIAILSATNDQTLAVLSAPGYDLQQIRGFSWNSRYLKARYRDKSGASSDWVWEVMNQNPVLKALPGNLAEDFSYDSRLFTRCNPDGTLSIYNLGSGSELKRLSGTRSFERLLLNPANHLLACCSEDDPRVEIRDVKSGQTNQCWNCPSSPTYGIAWSPDGKLLATGCLDNNIYVWDAATGKQRAVLQGHENYITAVTFDRDGNLLASSSFDGTTRLWDLHSSHQVTSLPSADNWELRFRPDNALFGAWRQGSSIFFGLMEVVKSRECRLLDLQDFGNFTSEPDFSADGRILAVGNTGRVRFWEVASGREIGSLPLLWCDTHVFTPDGRNLILTDRSGGVSVRSLDWTRNALAFSYLLGKPRRFYAGEMLCESALSLDGSHLAVTHESADESLVFDLEDPASKPVALRPHRAVDHIVISPDGHWVATSSWHDSLVKIWDARSGDLVRTLTMPGRTRAAFSPDGRWLATSTKDYRLWEVGSWAPKGPTVPGHAVPDWNFTAFSPDGRIMARTTDGHQIQMLETLTQKPLATLEAPGSSGVATFKFSPDGTHLAATQRNQQIQLWDLRLIRQELAKMNLDWDLPPYPPISDAKSEMPVTLKIDSDFTNQVPSE